MTLLLEKISSLVACVVVILLYSSSAVSALSLTREKGKVILVENQPFEFRCTVSGTLAELAGIKITWFGPDPVNDGKEIMITGKDANGKITVKQGTGNAVTSTLSVPKPPDFQYLPTLPFYQCKLEGKSNQESFPMKFVKAKAVPKIEPFELEPVNYKQSVLLNCTASYDNKNFKITEKFHVILSWIKDGKSLESKTYDYNDGEQTVEIQHSLTVESFRNGGKYVCVWKLALKEQPDFITKNYTVELPIFPYLNGPKEKEVEDTAGSDVELLCDVIGYPIEYQWRDEDNDLIDLDSRIRQEDNVLYIDDIEYEDRKEYLCLGIVVNETLKQTIILRVKDPLAPLWPFIGILVEAILVAAIIILAECYNKRTKNEKDGVQTETAEQPSTSLT